MPNVTFSIDATRMPADESLAELSRDCVELCTQVLEAELKNVHVIFLAVRHGHGHPASPTSGIASGRRARRRS